MWPAFVNPGGGQPQPGGFEGEHEHRRGGDDQEADELLERLGVGEGVGVLDRAVVHHVAYRQLDDFAALGAGDIGHLDHLGRHMARAAGNPDRRLDLFDQRFIQIDAGQTHNIDDQRPFRQFGNEL